MADNQGGLSCKQGSWGLAVGSGLIAAVLLMILGDWRLIPAIFAGIVLTIILGALLQWLVCRPLSAPGETPLRDPNPKPAPTSKESTATARADTEESAATARADTEPAPAPATPAAAAVAGAAKAGVKPAKALEGEAELASRKGSWKYDSGAAAPARPASAKPAAAEPTTAPAPSTDAPARLDAAREGGPDDLKRIRGVGPKLEQLLHSMGFYHFDQIAAWTDREAAWVDQNLEGFKGRVSRDKWVEQARTLAASGSSESSQKVERGGV